MSWLNSHLELASFDLDRKKVNNSALLHYLAVSVPFHTKLFPLIRISWSVGETKQNAATHHIRTTTWEKKKCTADSDQSHVTFSPQTNYARVFLRVYQDWLLNVQGATFTPAQTAYLCAIQQNEMKSLFTVYFICRHVYLKYCNK